jgi:hypothetical protein
MPSLIYATVPHRFECHSKAPVPWKSCPIPEYPGGQTFATARIGLRPLFPDVAAKMAPLKKAAGPGDQDLWRWP